MYDFVKIVDSPSPKSKFIRIVHPKFVVSSRSKDLMIRGGDFYAVYDEETKLWSTSEDTVTETIDSAMRERRAELEEKGKYDEIIVQWMWDSDSNSIDKWHKFVQRQMRDKFKPLDETITFANTKVKKTDYVSKRLDYALEEGDISAYDELIGTLYDEENRKKLEWAVGAIISGDSKHIQKFEVLYGSAGSGKSTFLNIVEALFKGYTSTFDAKGMGSFNNAFALDSLKNNPLVSIQHDGDLSRIEDNTMLNSVVSHEVIEVNPKYGKKYEAKFNTFLFLGTNKPVKITEAKSGLLRRLIDVHPTGNKVPYRKYKQLMKQIQFELGAIAYHCLKTYEEMGEEYYESYIPIDMMSATNDFFDFMENCYDDFLESDHVTLTEAWKRYKEYCEFAGAYQLSMRVVRNELRNYFRDYEDRGYVNGIRVRNLYSGFRADRFESHTEDKNGAFDSNSTDNAGDLGISDDVEWLDFKQQGSIFDEMFGDWPAQYEKDYGKGGQPEKAWSKCKTTLCNLDTSQTHYVKPPKDSNIVMADFDLRDENGEKSLELNREAACTWPKTYAELSKSGGGIHLYYFYNGDISKLSRIYAPGIEVKVFTGNSAIRRKLTLCNTEQIATLNGGLPLKGEKKLVNWDGIKNEKTIRTMIKRNLNKEYHADTTSSIDYIKKILDDAYASGIKYDVTDMIHAITVFAANSTNQADRCVETVSKMKFQSEESADPDPYTEEAPIIFLDCEVFPNLLLINWKYMGAEDCVHMINPSPEEVEALFKYRIIGFNNRKYDNHILYARSMGYSNEAIYRLSKSMIENHTGFFREAYNLSYTDVYDFCSKKQSLKKWEIELNIHHQELGMDWDTPVPEDKWEEVSRYCDNDVLATEAVFNARKADFIAREILAALAGGSVNDTTNQLSLKIIFGDEKKPELVYTDLATGKQYRGR